MSIGSQNWANNLKKRGPIAAVASSIAIGSFALPATAQQGAGSPGRSSSTSNPSQASNKEGEQSENGWVSALQWTAIGISAAAATAWVVQSDIWSGLAYLFEAPDDDDGSATTTSTTTTSGPDGEASDDQGTESYVFQAGADTVDLSMISSSLFASLDTLTENDDVSGVNSSLVLTMDLQNKSGEFDLIGGFEIGELIVKNPFSTQVEAGQVRSKLRLVEHETGQLKYGSISVDGLSLNLNSESQVTFSLTESVFYTFDQGADISIDDNESNYDFVDILGEGVGVWKIDSENDGKIILFDQSDQLKVQVERDFSAENSEWEIVANTNADIDLNHEIDVSELTNGSISFNDAGTFNQDAGIFEDFDPSSLVNVATLVHSDQTPFSNLTTTFIYIGLVGSSDFSIGVLRGYQDISSDDFIW